MRTIEWNDSNSTIKMIDQTLLPGELKFIECKNTAEVCEAIQNLRIRGAPALGVCGAFGVALAAQLSSADTVEGIIKDMKAAGEAIKKTRPTAINLAWGVDRVLQIAEEEGMDPHLVKNIALEEAKNMADEDVAINKKIGKNGAKLLRDGDVVLTHCNAGRMACVDWGTALGVIRSAVADGKKITVLACETRPLNQGSRITAWELQQDKIPVQVITDSTAGFLMSEGVINKVIVGADRITQEFVYNKIGTYTHSVLAKEHNIPFYVAAPVSTLDPDSWEENVQIERRSENELRYIGSCKDQNVPNGVPILNLAFDKTPMENVSAIITENGVFSPPILIDEIILG
ncbi:S-methyl-5-thioribose-1-phosphate isomerase [Methanimicrococcus blatticola]|uniref:Putative methylthioribose-1-phosphate isomerase n=1 Tax=Methanimicrococcus blatticola TaxID=91560 RepID=A0A484F3G7_9EURY|nr:S-methyl-5-thioribose-1-phosphate isomerase [Methanimicrococcus blatticola]MBZ3935273.1 S-methyl-5-thioribose-1-phosphate isomerase [Methanimicrococcus blatticola]MCC2508629.1 S-methyl-5-thioribose-1-phosphate isomerase [Methanimicrococcus blatticola]TDQ67934.1 translation initiation factor 2B subunit I family (IF-2BI) [Methanimicrococcus blatticola]